MKLIINAIIVIIGFLSQKTYGEELTASGLSLVTINNNNFQLQLDDLKEILGAEDIKNREVVVVSITGAYRQGKSFLLNFFLKYLYAEYKNHNSTDWLESNSENTKVFNGFKWKTGRNRETTGINMWSEIFTHDFPDGRKVAILLIDTQGIFDDETSQHESTAIFALSAIISSVQIYNVMNNIQEDNLQHLQFFTEYGRLVAGMSNEKPFQLLMFVVRDWQYGDSEGYGLINGERIINETLNESSRVRIPEMQQLRERIRSSFHEIGAFLMPSPGSNVRKSSFNGEMNKIDEEYLQCVSELTLALFSPDNLVSKINNGRLITASEWIHYIDEYIKAFNHSEFKPETLVAVNAKVSNSILSSKSQNIYEKMMDNAIKQDSKRYFNDNELIELHKKCKNESLIEFMNAPKFGGDEYASPALQELDGWIDNTFQDIKRIQEQNVRIEMNNVEMFARDAQHSYENTMNTSIDWLITNNHFVSNEDIQQRHQRLKNEVIFEFKNRSKFSGIDYSSTLQKLDNSIEEKFENINEIRDRAHNAYCQKRSNDGMKWGGGTGALAGAAIGTAIAPGVGTLIGLLLGGAGGSLTGSTYNGC